MREQTTFQFRMWLRGTPAHSIPSPTTLVSDCALSLDGCYWRRHALVINWLIQRSVTGTVLSSLPLEKKPLKIPSSHPPLLIPKNVLKSPIRWKTDFRRLQDKESGNSSAHWNLSRRVENGKLDKLLLKSDFRFESEKLILLKLSVLVPLNSHYESSPSPPTLC